MKVCNARIETHAKLSSIRTRQQYGSGEIRLAVVEEEETFDFAVELLKGLRVELTTDADSFKAHLCFNAGDYLQWKKCSLCTCE